MAKPKKPSRPGGRVPTYEERAAKGKTRLEVWIPNEKAERLDDYAKSVGIRRPAAVVAAIDSLPRAPKPKKTPGEG